MPPYEPQVWLDARIGPDWRFGLDKRVARLIREKNGVRLVFEIIYKGVEAEVFNPITARRVVSIKVTSELVRDNL